jgi:hypothetical protein
MMFGDVFALMAANIARKADWPLENTCFALA